MSTKEKTRVPKEQQQIVLEESQEKLCEEQQRRGQYIAYADKTAQLEGINTNETETRKI